MSRRWQPNQETKDAINEVIAMNEASMNIGNFTEAKIIMNNYFGAENNQIVKPDPEEITDYLYDSRGAFTASDVRRLSIHPDWKKVFKKMYVIVRFPELVITNNPDAPRSHTIKDLWVKFEINEQFTLGYGLWGVRSTLSLPEALSKGYHHSHLVNQIPSDPVNPPHFDSFCLGDGEINQVISILANDGFDKINFTLFCLHLKNYVVWESVEGRPYRRFTSVLDGTVTNSTEAVRSLISLNNNNTKHVIKWLKDEIAMHYNLDDIKHIFVPTIVHDEVTLEVDDNLLIFLGHILTYVPSGIISQSNLGTTNNILCNRLPDGRYVNIGNVERPERLHIPTKPMFKFKGKPVYFNIENFDQYDGNPQTINTNTNVYAHPTIAESFAKSFRGDFAETCYIFETFIKKDSLEDLFQTSGANLLPMSRVS